ncbi:hypothetical protein F511_41878 [Dorcoceras hygrometricum]|uniref:Uncharacterized protein n=1 Tax=Dorcoceras hygrometricum TaxID=472368 RepID=A0A2Z7AVL9_9LAMI|nr:hypothetical protein F511_41878 [Dorcoceras hygrometricum]
MNILTNAEESRPYLQRIAHWLGGIRLHQLASSGGTVKKRDKRPPRRSRLQETGETSRTENPPLTAAQIAQLVAATVEQILANRPKANPLPDEQADEIRGLREEVARLREARVAETPPLPARVVSFYTEVLAAELPQHFKFPNMGEYDGMGDLEEHLSRFENAALLHQYADPIKCRVFRTTLVDLHNSGLISYCHVPRTGLDVNTGDV